MSDTPETDHLESNLGTAARCHPAIWMHARQMERERDEAREALMKIEEIFVDGDNTHDDWWAMGQIARTALEGAK